MANNANTACTTKSILRIWYGVKLVLFGRYCHGWSILLLAFWGCEGCDYKHIYKCVCN